MRDKFTTNEFELDLSELDISIDEESPRFKDNLSTKFTFPFEFNIDAHLTGKMSDYSSIQALQINKKYEGKLTLDGRIKDAELVILSSAGKVIRAQIDLGFDDFPNANKKLRDLPLGVVTSTSAMHEEANAVIGKTYPEVNYNFPMVHTDSYKGDAIFADFLGAYNHRKDGDFVNNEARVEENFYSNKNIVVPMPYLLHVLKTGIEDAGCTLHGDIMKLEQLQKMIVVPSKKIQIFDRPDTVEWIIGVESKVEKSINIALYESTQPLNFYGKFRLKGRVIPPMIIFHKVHDNSAYPRIYLNDVLVWDMYSSQSYELDITIMTSVGQKNELRFKGVSEDLNGSVNIGEIEITPLELWDEDGKPKKSLANLEKYDLAEGLPDIDFITLITAVKNLYNLDWDIRNGTEVWMNFIDSAFEDTHLVDISEFEVKDPERIYNADSSYLLQYKEVESEEYQYKKVFIDIDGMKTENFKEVDGTQKTEINALPLPMLTQNNLRTAYQFVNNESLVQIVLYDGLKDGKNTTNDASELINLDQHILKYHKRWIDFLIRTTDLKWTFFANKNHWRNINSLNTLYAYKRKHWIKEISKRSVNHRTYEITLHTKLIQ
ncbi:hypothetical protein [Ornithobacterium rhinotracheale]|uniref:hypothetical protein n=1 Tax=Ornithobacterium rhinotracheale TaxID=28251 RepID=UPI001FF342FA|nr:hypothetical protein [Ornithobacterium rhinotracheale]MCK0199142.1 hypothetical protein [Ornithobacterium rhinotracheale]